MKAALYARFSTDLQRAASIEDQFRNCRKRAELEGWSIVATFADAAMSGHGRHERMHLTLKKEATRPAGRNFLQQQASLIASCSASTLSVLTRRST
jgi:hypothetical protein